MPGMEPLLTQEIVDPIRSLAVTKRQLGQETKLYVQCILNLTVINCLINGCLYVRRKKIIQGKKESQEEK